MKIGILTSSRADYSQYYPLLLALAKDPFFKVEILAFGSHLSQKHGYTITQILEDKFEVRFRLQTLAEGDDPQSIDTSMSGTIAVFAELWASETFDLVFAFGDRYEMFAACASLVAFGMPMAHIHGGETTTGAIDNVFRHAITQMAQWHFTTTEVYRDKVIQMKGANDGVYNVGALSIDNLYALPLLSMAEFRERFGIDMSVPSILITFHPETIAFSKNELFVEQLIAALRETSGYQFIITMPNADTGGNMVRKKLLQFIDDTEHAIGVESFGTIGYLSCMKYASLMLGNTSSGFLEASFFPKYVINLGTRQSGRILTPNIITCAIEKEKIKQAIKDVPAEPIAAMNLYGDGTAAKRIAAVLKDEVWPRLQKAPANESLHGAQFKTPQ